MKLPPSVLIKGQRWKVRKKNRVVDDDGNLVHGMVCYEKKIIYIERGLKKSLEELVFCHEVVHAAMHELHIDLGYKMNESLTDGVTTILHQIFKLSLRN